MILTNTLFIFTIGRLKLNIRHENSVLNDTVTVSKKHAHALRPSSAPPPLSTVNGADVVPSHWKQICAEQPFRVVSGLTVVKGSFTLEMDTSSWLAGVFYSAVCGLQFCHSTAENHLIIQFRFVKICSMRTIVFYEQHIGLWILRLFLKIKKKMLRIYQNESHHVTITANREETPIV